MQRRFVPRMLVTALGGLLMAAGAARADSITFSAGDVVVCDGNGAVWFVNAQGQDSSKVRLSADGTGGSVDFDGQGRIIVGGSGLHRIDPSSFDPASMGTALNVTKDGGGSIALFGSVSVGSAGNIYFNDDTSYQRLANTGGNNFTAYNVGPVGYWMGAGVVKTDNPGSSTMYATGSRWGYSLVNEANHSITGLHGAFYPEDYMSASLAIDTPGNRLFVGTWGDGGTAGIYSCNMDTNVATLVVDSGPATGIAYYDGAVYASTRYTDGLKKIDLATNAVTPLGDVYIHYPQGIAVFQPPSVTITNPVNGASFVHGSDIQIDVTVAHFPGAVTNVDFYDGLNLLGNATSAPYSFTWAGVTAAGSHALTAVAQDDTGKTLASEVVNVTVEAISSKAITSFVINGISGTIDEVAHTIALTMPYGTDRTALTPMIEITGTSVSPDSGVAQDFSNPVDYWVTAANASEQAYTVTVTVALNPAKAITSFMINGVKGTIDEGTHTIALNLPFGTDVSALTPVIEMTGESVSPGSGVAQDFSSPVGYTVQAADASTQDYTVTVTLKVWSSIMLGVGDVVVCDWNGAVWYVNAQGQDDSKIQLAPNGTGGWVTFDAQGRILVSGNSSALYRIDPASFDPTSSGTALKVTLPGGSAYTLGYGGVGVGPAGNIYFEGGGNQIYRLENTAGDDFTALKVGPRGDWGDTIAVKTDAPGAAEVFYTGGRFGVKLARETPSGASVIRSGVFAANEYMTYALAYDPTGNRLFVSTLGDGGAHGIYSINLADNSATTLAQGEPASRGLAYFNGLVYAPATSGQNGIFLINPVTATRTQLGNVSLNSPTGIAVYNPAGASGGYTAWANANAGGETSNLDFDHDGVPNGVEYFMGIGPTDPTFTANPGVLNRKIRWPHSAAATDLTFRVVTSEDLATWTDVTLDAIDAGGFLEYTLPSVGPRLFVRLEVVTVP